jgi:hypothetical protein
MSKAMEQIVNAYVRLNNRRGLEDLRMHRQKLAVDLKGRAGDDFSLPIGQIDQELAVMEAGLDKLNAAVEGRGTIAKGSPQHIRRFLRWRYRWPNMSRVSTGSPGTSVLDEEFF